MGLGRLTPASGMRVLVTGADGQLGRDVLDALAELMTREPKPEYAQI